jgi:PAS domain-containing protein
MGASGSRSTPEMLHSVTVLLPEPNRGPVDLEIIPLADTHALVVFKDTSRRLRLESHVRRLITAIDATPEVFFITDADFRITFANPAFQITTGYSVEEVLGRIDLQHQRPDSLSRINLGLTPSPQSLCVRIDSTRASHALLNLYPACSGFRLPG